MEDEIEKQDVNDQENINGNANDADTLSAIAQQASNDESSGIGGTDSQDQEADQDDLSSEELLSPVIKLSSDLFAPLWGVQQEEADALAKVWAPVADKWFPGLSGSVGVEFNAAIVTLAVFGPKIMMPRTEEQAKRIAKQQQLEEKGMYQEHQQAANDPQPQKQSQSILDIEETVDGVKLH